MCKRTGRRGKEGSASSMCSMCHTQKRCSVTRYSLISAVRVKSFTHRDLPQTDVQLVPEFGVFLTIEKSRSMVFSTWQ